jgi:hypothetical protein
VLIAFTELDAELKVVQGEVIAHSPSKQEIYQKLLQLENERIAIEFTGEMPKEPAYLRFETALNFKQATIWL